MRSGCDGYAAWDRSMVATALSRYPAEYTAPWAVIVPDSEPEPPSPAAPACTVRVDDLYPVAA